MSLPLPPLPRTYLTSPQLVAAIRELEGVDVPIATLQAWSVAGTLVPTVRWDRAKGRYHPRLYSVGDLLTARLIVRLRYRENVPMPRVREVLAYLDGLGVLRSPAVARRAVVAVDDRSGRVTVGRAGERIEVPTGQRLLPLQDVAADVRHVAERAMRRAG
jgi:DNA-binding transcriptional MerR regulator